LLQGRSRTQDARLAHTHEVVEAARTAGATIMHAPIMFADGYH
jgi:hypothetical protein